MIRVSEDVLSRSKRGGIDRMLTLASGDKPQDHQVEGPTETEFSGNTGRSIRAGKVLADLLDGISDRELMDKYGLSEKKYRKLLRKLVDDNFIDHAHLYEKSAHYRRIFDHIASRQCPRLNIPIAIRAYHHRTSQKGFVRDISEDGLRVAGIDAKIGETITLCLPLVELEHLEPVEFEATCRWKKTKGKSIRYVVSGFEIRNISPEARNSFRKLMDLARNLTHDTAVYDQRSLDTWELPSMPRAGQTEVTPHQFSGELDGVDILDVVQLGLLSRMKRILVITSDSGVECELYLEGGRIVHALEGSKEGEEAFLGCVNCQAGRFCFKPWVDPPKRSIGSPSDWLLLEAARRRDDSRENGEPPVH
jgi:hypothetical protein